MLRSLLRPLLLLLLGALLPVLFILVFWIKQLPELSLWHTQVPQGEFTAERQDIKTLSQYQALENQLFAQVANDIVAKTASNNSSKINRFASNSSSNPLQYKTNWNQSFLLQGRPDHGAVLLLHGLTDSPYSLRSIGQALHQQGYTVLGLRLPSHGTAPSALTTFKWQDAAAAVRMAMRDLALTHKEIHIVGYSTGAALATEYQLAQSEGENLPVLKSLTLIAPAIAVSGSAHYAKYVRLLAPISGVGAAAWSDIVPEYDPYKYNSFPLNAAVQMDELTAQIKTGLARNAPLKAWPPTQVYLSAVDNTILAEPIVSLFMNRLPQGSHQLMLYDMNRQAALSPLLKTAPAAWAIELGNQQQPKPYRLQFVSNRKADQSAPLLIEDTAAGSTKTEVKTTDMNWPEGVFAVSHLGMTFSAQDPIVGAADAQKNTLTLSRDLVGERGVLDISSSSLIRLRYNPFYTLQEQEILQFIGAHDK